MASSSVAALLVGGGAPTAFAACYTGPFTGGYANAGGISCITVIGTSFTGNLSNTGTISSGANNGITVSNASVVGSGSTAGSVINAGTINASAGYGILLTNNANASSGVTNSGAISARFSGVALTSSSTFGGSINNSGHGTISATGNGINVTAVGTFAGGLTNSGTISAGSTGVALYNVGTLAGGITNSNGGTISASNGITVNLVAQLNGGITNGGKIVAAQTGIAVANVTTFAHDIVNSGTISSNGIAGITLSAVSQFSSSITNSGKITAAQTGIAVANVTTFTGGIVNSGTIVAPIASNTSAGIRLNTVGQFSGGVTNSSGGTISGRTGISVNSVTQFGGGISNGGMIAAGETGIGVNGFSTFGGGITNSGTISSSRAAIGVTAASQFSGGIGNSGTITTLGDGIEASVSTFANGITNSSGGTISAGIGIAVSNITELGLVVTTSSFSGGVTNNGVISAVKSGIAVSGISTFTGGIVNTGTISSLTSGGHAGIEVGNPFGGSKVTQFNGGIANSGTITAVGAGIKVTTVSTFSGGIVNSSGGKISAFTAVNVSNVRQFAGGITNSGAITANKTGIFVGTITSFSGNVSNAGTITGVSGIRVLGGVTFAAGSAIVNSGTITASAVAIDAHTATGAVTIDQVGGVLNGKILLSPNADVLNVTGGAINGNIIGQGSSDTVNFTPGTGNTFTYGNNFTGINQVNINSGTVVLNGSDVASNVDVNGGTLAGTGTLDPLAVTIHSGAMLAPGAPGVAGGKLSIVGSLVFQSAAAYLVTINGASASYTAVTGTATLGGASITLANGSTVVAGLKYTILTDTGGGLGGSNTFAGAVSYGKYKAVLSYDADDVYLTFQVGTLRGLLPASAPINITNTAAAIDNFTSNGGSAPAAFQNLSSLSPAQLQNALAQLSGEAATGAERSAFQMTTDFLNLTLDPFVSGRGGNDTGGPALGFAPEQGTNVPDDVARAYASILGKAPSASFQQRWRAWGSAYGGSSTSHGDPVAGSNNVTVSTVGFAGGMDYRFTPSTLAGFALAGGGTGWGLANALGGGRSDALQVGGYGISWFGPAYLAGALASSNHWFTTNRIALGDQLAASFMGQSYGVRFEGGYRYGVFATLGLTPYGAVQAQNFHASSYSERDLTGGGFGLSYGARNATDLRTELGARFDAPTLLYDRPLILYGRAAWAHDFVSAPTLGAAFEALPGGGFAVNGAPIPHDSALTSVGAQLHVSANWSLAGTFNGDFASGAQTYGGSGTLSHTW